MFDKRKIVRKKANTESVQKALSTCRQTADTAIYFAVGATRCLNVLAMWWQFDHYRQSLTKQVNWKTVWQICPILLWNSLLWPMDSRLRITGKLLNGFKVDISHQFAFYRKISDQFKKNSLLPRMTTPKMQIRNLSFLQYTFLINSYFSHMIMNIFIIWMYCTM